MSIAEKLTTIAENQQKVFDAGIESEYDRFWDAFQRNGERTNYYVAFYSSDQRLPVWTDDNFKPKHAIAPSNAQNMLYCSSVSGDLRTKATIDFSKATNVNSAISYCPNLTTIGVLDLRKVSTNSISAVTYCNVLETIEEIIFKEDGTQYASSTGFSFAGCPLLEEVRITGAINFNFNAGMCTKLSKASIESIVNALYAPTTGKTFTVSSSAVTAAFGSTDAKEWKDLVDTKPNWTVVLGG